MQIVVFENVLQISEEEQMIAKGSHSGVVLPSNDWHLMTFSASSGVSMTYSLRVSCDNNYYNTTCTKLCRPRHDAFGHYRCDSNGDKVWLQGWMGTNCETGRLSTCWLKVDMAQNVYFSNQDKKVHNA